MKIADMKNPIAQGDVLLLRVAKLPPGVVPVKRNGPLVIAHSETGHHHVIENDNVTMYDVPGNPLLAYLQFEGPDCGAGIDLVHQRPWDSHETWRMLGRPGDVIEIRRQREWRPEGWSRVAD